MANVFANPPELYQTSSKQKLSGNCGPTEANPAPPASFSDLRKRISEDPATGWNARYKAAVIADMSRLIELDPAIAMLQPTGTVIMPRFRSLTPLTTELSVGRINNIKSSCRAAFGYAGRRWAGMRGLRSLTTSWQALWQLILGNRDCTIYLSKFGHWCSGEGIEPDQVSDAVLARYRSYLAQVIGAADDAVQKMVRRWNRCAQVIDGWPKTRLTAPYSSRKGLTPKLAEMGELLRGDLSAYVELMRHGSQLDSADPFDCIDDENGEAESTNSAGRGRASRSMRPYAEATIIARIDILRRLIGLCSRATNKTLQELRLADLVTKKNASLLLKLYRTELGNDTSHALVNSAHALVVLARYYVHVDDATQSALDRYAANILGNRKQADRTRSGGMTPKNRDRLEQLKSKQITALFRLPSVLLNSALARVRANKAGPADLVDAEVAAAITILLHAPLRSRNTVSIEVGRHLLFPAGSGSARLVFPPTEVKNDVELVFDIPPDATQLLRAYFMEVRPYFGRARQSNFLFPGVRKKSKAPGHLGCQILQRIQDAIGVTLNQHLFRHLVALLYLRRCPGQYEVIRILLGHKSVATTRKYYCGLEAEAALEHFRKIMAEWKAEAGVNPDDMTRLVGLPGKPRLTRRKVMSPRMPKSMDRQTAQQNGTLRRR